MHKLNYLWKASTNKVICDQVRIKKQKQMEMQQSDSIFYIFCPIYSVYNFIKAAFAPPLKGSLHFQ